MKTALSLFLAFAGACIVTASPVSGRDGVDDFRPIPLAGEDYIPGPRLFPRNVIAGYNAELSEYNADSWAQHVLEQCTTFSACTVSASYSAINSGSPGGRYWFGYVFRGGPAGPEDFEEAPSEAEVQDARAYSIPFDN